MANSKTLVLFGYCLPALASGIFLSSLSFAGDVASALVFALAQALVVRSARWTVVTAAGFLVGWSIGTGAAAAGGVGAAVVYGLVTHAALSDSELQLVAFPVAGLVGGAATGAIAGLLQLAGGRRLPPLSWVAGNCAGGALTGVPLLFAFTTHSSAPAMAAVFAACAAGGLLWGLLIARIRVPEAT